MHMHIHMPAGCAEITVFACIWEFSHLGKIGLLTGNMKRGENLNR